MKTESGGSLLANAFAMLVARLLLPATSFAINIAIARMYGPASLGAYVHLLTSLLIFQTVAGAGMSLLLPREIAARPEEAESEIRSAWTLAWVTGGLATVGFVAWVILVVPSDRYVPSWFLAATILPSAWITVLEAFFAGTRTHHRLTWTAAVENGMKLALASLAFAAGAGLTGVCAAIAASRVAALATGTVLMRAARLRAPWGGDVAAIRALARRLIPFAAILTLSMFYFRVDVLLVEAFLGGASTGLYGAALGLYSIVLLLPDSVLSAVYPRLAAASRSSREDYAHATLLAVRLLATAIVPLALLIMCLPEQILAAAYGGRFRGAAGTLSLLAASLPLHAINGAVGQALQARGLQGSMLPVIVVGVLAHMAMTAALLPLVGIQGAAVSLFASSALVTLGAGLSFHRNVSPLSRGHGWVSALVAMFGPIAVTMLAPGPLKVAGAGAGLAWLAASTAWEMRKAPDFVRTLRAMAPRLTAHP